MPKIVRLEEAPTDVGSTVYTTRSEGEPIGTIAIVTRDHLTAAAAMSLLMIDFSWVPKGQNVQRSIITGGILTMQRNEAVQRMQGDWLLFIDDDMVFEPDAVKQLVEVQREHDLDIVGGLCFRRQPPHQPTLYMREGPTSGGYNFLERWDDGPVEVDATGLAFCLITRRAFETIAGTPMPSFDERASTRPPSFFGWNNILGEDLQFCQDAKKHGLKIWVDTRIEIGHVSEFTVDKTWFWREVATREPDIEEKRLTMNAKMGLPTLTAAEAKEKLGWS
jgi:hypothetical protein